jgi:myo-inositol 2-dehydrogenase/D-chiro-inositol 1-dehydrogenase
MPPTRIGVVGAGFIAGRHVDTLCMLPDVAVVGVADPQADRATQLAARAGAAAYPDLQAMLEHLPLDAVYLCVPPAAHGDPERAVLARGLGLFVEKPLGVDLAEAEKLALEIEAAGVPTATGYRCCSPRAGSTAPRAPRGGRCGRPPAASSSSRPPICSTCAGCWPARWTR